MVPYGLPGGKDKDPKAKAKMERCVTKVMGQGRDKQTAIKICKTSLFGADVMQASVEPVLGPLPNSGLDWDKLMAAGLPKEPEDLLYFKGARYALAEVNKNRDGITGSGVEDLARTLPFMPITVEHKEREICGFYTAARAKGRSVYADGVVWARRWPEVVVGINAGKLGHSLEAYPDFVVCSVCGEVATASEGYCEHLTNKDEHDAVRWSYGLQAVGGGITDSPAGSDCYFSMEDGHKIVMVGTWFSEEPVEGSDEDDDRHQEPPPKVDGSKIVPQTIPTEGSQMGDLDILKQKVTDLEALVAETNEKLDQAIKERDELRAQVQQKDLSYNRAMELAEYLPIDDIKAKMEDLWSMSDGAFDLMKSAFANATDDNDEPIVGSEGDEDDDDGGDNEPPKKEPVVAGEGNDGNNDDPPKALKLEDMI